MHPFPHVYTVAAGATVEGDVELRGERLPPLRSAPPAAFDGPGDRWSPETLLVAAVGDCLVLTFRAVASASRIAWLSLDCEVVGTLDRIERVTRFVGFELRARLRVPPGTDRDRAIRALEKAEQSCLITNSLSAPVTLVPTVEVVEQEAASLKPA